MATLSDRLTRVSDLLSPNIPTSGRHAVITALIKNPDSSISSDVNPDRDIEQLAMKLCDIVGGGMFAHEFCGTLKDYLSATDKDFKIKTSQFVRVTLGHDSLEAAVTIDGPNDKYNKCYLNNKKNYANFDDDIPLTVNAGAGEAIVGGVSGTPNPELTRASPSLVAIELMNPKVGMTNRDSSVVGIFTSLITPIEMSRCVPYISIKTGGVPSVTGGKLSGTSLLGYLIGRDEPAPTSGIDSSLLLNPSSQPGSSQPVSSSMELFTAPQTLVSTMDSQAFTERGNIPAVLDRFRPLMSLKGLSFSVIPSKGFMSYKSGKVELVLHDKSRLGEVASFVKPGLYQGTEFDIEYGWSHPNGFSSNTPIESTPMGVFLDSMKVREKYSIINSSFNFDDAGQVNISLDIAMKGSKSFETLSISDCASIPGTSELDQLVKTISEIIAELDKGGDKSTFSNLFDSTIVGSAGSSDAALSLDEKALGELRTKINSLKAKGLAPEFEGLTTNLDNLFKVGGVADKYKVSVDDAVKSEFDKLRSGKEIFPCSDAQVILDSSDIILPNITSSDNIIQDPISLGRLFLSFIGKPLVRTGHYEEVQFIFHTFNEKASFMRGLSIAKFPINSADLEKEIAEILKKSMKMSLIQFAQHITSKFVSEPSAVIYGFRTLYEVDKETGAFKPKNEGTAEASKSKDSILDAAGIGDATFKLPKISVYPECVPHHKDKSKTILRLHVIDETCTSFSSMYDLLKSARSGDISSFGLSDNPVHPLLSSAPELESGVVTARRQAEIDDMTSKGVVTQITTEITDPLKVDNIEINVGALLKAKSVSQVKKFISAGVPVIRFGTSTGTIMSVGVSSMNDPAMSTVNLMRANKTNTGTPDLSRDRGIPLQIAPVECSIEMLGCPLLSFGQNFFVDLGTGTTADNIYFVTGIDHKIEAGAFTTSVKLTLLDSYGTYRSPARKVAVSSKIISAMSGKSTSSAKTSETSAPGTPTPDTATKAAGSPGGVMTILGLDSITIYKELNALKEPYNGIYVLVDKSSKKAYAAFPGNKNYLAGTAINTPELNKIPVTYQKEDSKYALVRLILTLGGGGTVAVDVYNMSLKPAEISQRDELVGWLGTAGSNTSLLVVDTSDWAQEVAKLNVPAA